ncbi:unnamed protein product, partial [Symbiodinium necroappetens]
GLQVSIDFTQAFDRVDRGLLNSALLMMKVPEELRSLIMQWVETTTFHVVQDDEDEMFAASRGIRQGCWLSPTLWVCVSVFLLHTIEQELGERWCNDHLVGFADDTHLRWDIFTAPQLHQALDQAHRVLHILEQARLKLSRDKTVCLLRLEGGQAAHIKRKITEKTKDGRYLKLGACITYGDFEHKNVKHRVHAGKVAFQRVRKFLMAEKAASLQKRLRLWKAIVIPTVMYSITASGLLPKGFDLLRIMLTRPARAIARSPRYRTGGENGEDIITESDESFWRKVGLCSPAELVRQRLEATVTRTKQFCSTLPEKDARGGWHADVLYVRASFLEEHEARTFQWRRSQFARITGTCEWCDKKVSRGENADTMSAGTELVTVPLPEVAANKHWTKQCGQLPNQWLKLCVHSGPPASKVLVSFAEAALKHSLSATPAVVDDSGPNLGGGVPGNLRGNDAGSSGHCGEEGSGGIRTARAKQTATLGDYKGFQGQGLGQGKSRRKRMEQSVSQRELHSEPEQISTEDWQHMMHIISRLLVQHDTELQMLKLDKQYLLHFEMGPQGMVHMFWEAAQVWKKARDEQPPKVDKSLRITLLLCMMMELEGRLDKMMVHEQTKDNLIKHGWLQTTMGQPAWPYM